MSLGQSSTVRAVPAASLRKVSKFGTVASHQDRLPAYRSGALSRSGLERVNSAVEWHTQNRCFLTRKIVRDGVPIKAMGPVCSSLSERSAIFIQQFSRNWRQPSSRQSGQSILVPSIVPTRPTCRSLQTDLLTTSPNPTDRVENAVYSHYRLFGGRPRWPRMAFS